MASNQNWSPTQLKAPRQPRPGPAPGQALGRVEGWAAQSLAGVSPVHVVGGGACPRHHSM